MNLRGSFGSMPTTLPGISVTEAQRLLETQDRILIGGSQVHAIPYKQSVRTLIVATLSQMQAAQMLKSLFASEAQVDPTGLKIISQPYDVPGITVDTYRQKGLIVLGARLSQELYRSYLSFVSTGRAA